MKTRGFIFGLVLVLGTGTSVFADTSTGPLSFQAWKTSRVEEAKTALDRIQSEESSVDKSAEARPLPDKAVTVKQLATAPTPAQMADPNTRLHKSVAPGVRGDQKLSQAQLNLEIAQELSINDYFILYLSQLKGKDAFVEAAKKLNPDDMAELMMAYSRSLSGDDGTGDASKTPKAGL